MWKTFEFANSIIFISLIPHSDIFVRSVWRHEQIMTIIKIIKIDPIVIERMIKAPKIIGIAKNNAIIVFTMFLIFIFFILPC